MLYGFNNFFIKHFSTFYLNSEASEFKENAKDMFYLLLENIVISTLNKSIKLTNKFRQKKMLRNRVEH